MQVLLLDVCEKLRPTVLFITHDIDEAIFLGQRILVMSRAPGRVVKEIEVNLDKSNEFEVTATPEYMEIKRTILTLFREMARNAEVPKQSEVCQ
jgi:NitT/TauT family transport system ATP-binding protein